MNLIYLSVDGLLSILFRSSQCSLLVFSVFSVFQVWNLFPGLELGLKPALVTRLCE